ncbi:MAG: TonB-dependent receptor plug domain-containing protein, partial [Pseudomonadota bacterium]
MITLQTRIASNGLSRNAKRALMGGVAATAMFGLPQAAFAQDAEVQDVSFEDENVIIVQARRQNESLQEVPVTVTAIGGETLERYGVDQVADVVSRVPSLNVQVGGSGSGGQLSLRGVGSSNISSSFDSAVAFDFDGVQVSSMRLVQAGFFDTQQIDVLKGPQSLFFGKSASAGVFAIRSADPTPDWEIGGQAQYEFEEKGYTVGGYISGPISDNLGIRIAAQYNDIDEFLLLQPGTPTVHGDARSASNFVGRVTLAYDDNDRFDANLKVQYVRNTNDGAISHGDISCGANGVADPIVLLGGGLVIDPGYDCNAFDQRQFLPDAAAAVSASIPTPSLAAGRNGVPFGETDVWFGRLLWNLDLSDNLTLTSTT